MKTLSPSHEELDGHAEFRDEANLARLGKKPVLKVSRDSNGWIKNCDSLHSSGILA